MGGVGLKTKNLKYSDEKVSVIMPVYNSEGYKNEYNNG